jgi:hypothetical protein
MNTPSHDFVTVDMRGLKAALVARAQADRTTVSVLVRTAVARELGVAGEGAQAPAPATSTTPEEWVKLSIRMPVAEAIRLDLGARAAGLSRAAFLAGLVAEVPILTSGGRRNESIASLVASNAVMADLARDLRHLTQLLSRGDVAPARVYRQRLDTVGDEVRAHLRLASRTLADLKPRRA